MIKIYNLKHALHFQKMHENIKNLEKTTVEVPTRRGYI